MSTKLNADQHQPAIKVSEPTDGAHGPVEHEPARWAVLNASIDIAAWIILAVAVVASVNLWELSAWLLIVAGIAVAGAVVSTDRLGALIAQWRRARNREKGALRP